MKHLAHLTSVPARSDVLAASLLALGSTALAQLSPPAGGGYPAQNTALGDRPSNR